MMGIVDVVLVCGKCGQKIKMKHLKCEKEKRDLFISEFLKPVRELIDKANYSCGYTDKFSDFLDNLENIIDKLRERSK